MSQHTIDDAMLEFCLNSLLKDFTIQRKWTRDADETEPNVRKYLKAHLISLVSVARKTETWTQMRLREKEENLVKSPPI